MRRNFGRQIIKSSLILIVALILGGISSNIFAQKGLVEVFDGRNTLESPKATGAEQQFIKTEVRAHESAVKTIAKSKEFKCDEDDAKENVSNTDVTANLQVYGVLQGSFTKAKSSQQAFFYHLCWSDGGKYATALGGVVITEKQKIVSHFIYTDVSGFDNPRVLPDINRNGLSEIVLGFTSKIDGLMIGRSIGIFEIGTDKIANLGAAEIFDMKTDETLAYKISGKSEKNPVYYSETYTTDPDSEKEIWQIREKNKKFSLDKIDAEKDFGFVSLSSGEKTSEK